MTTTFQRLSSLRRHMIGEGIVARAVNGERMTMAVIDLEPNVALPEHHHENEQLGFLISGVITMRIGSESQKMQAGDTYSIPSNVPHDPLAGPEGCTVADVFAPIRSDWANLKYGEPAAGRWPILK